MQEEIAGEHERVDVINCVVVSTEELCILMTKFYKYLSLKRRPRTALSHKEVESPFSKSTIDFSIINASIT